MQHLQKQINIAERISHVCMCVRACVHVYVRACVCVFETLMAYCSTDPNLSWKIMTRTDIHACAALWHSKWNHTPMSQEMWDMKWEWTGQ